jgi:hypothetical protein
LNQNSVYMHRRFKKLNAIFKLNLTLYKVAVKKVLPKFWKLKPKLKAMNKKNGAINLKLKSKSFLITIQLKNLTKYKRTSTYLKTPKINFKIILIWTAVSNKFDLSSSKRN